MTAAERRGPDMVLWYCNLCERYTAGPVRTVAVLSAENDERQDGNYKFRERSETFYACKLCCDALEAGDSINERDYPLNFQRGNEDASPS